MKRKRRNLPNMPTLYGSFIFQKTTVLIFIFSLILMIVGIFIFSNPWLDLDAYKAGSEGFHEAYFNQSLFVLTIFNGIFVTTIVISLALQSQSFDILFISSIKRTEICISKIMAAILLFFLLSIFEYILIYVFPVFLYDEYQIGIESLFTILYFFLYMLFEFSISMAFVTLVMSIFTPMLILFLFLLEYIITTSFHRIKEAIEGYLPILEYEGGQIICHASYVMPFWILVFILFYITIYNIKDL